MCWSPVDCVCWAERLKVVAADRSISSRHIPPNSNICPPSITREGRKQSSSLGRNTHHVHRWAWTSLKFMDYIHTWQKQIQTEGYKQNTCQDQSTDHCWHGCLPVFFWWIKWPWTPYECTQKRTTVSWAAKSLHTLSDHIRDQVIAFRGDSKKQMRRWCKV